MLMLSQLTSIFSAMTFDPGSGRNNDFDNSGCVLNALEAHRCGFYVQESLQKLAGYQLVSEAFGFG